MRIAFYEDQAASALGPIALTRPVFELLCGQFTLRERVTRRFKAFEWGAFLRPYLAESYRESRPQARVNDTLWLKHGSTLFINGRWLPTLEALANIRHDEAGYVDNTLVYLVLDPLESSLMDDRAWDDSLEKIAESRTPIVASGKLISHPWDLVNHNAEQLAADFRLRRYGLPKLDEVSHVAVLGPVENIYIDPSARIDPFVVLDGRRGPVSVDAGAIIGSFTQLEGPCHVGHDSQLFRAHVRESTTIGPVCRVGGEIEASILHGYVNKYHTGFLGHSYICPWVNLGALSTNSDLKNDYSKVNVPLAGEPIETGSTKVGCFIGDHTKTALGSLFNTGSSIGVMCMILPDGRLLPKHIPSFTRMWDGELTEEWDVDGAFAAAGSAVGRRNCEFTPAQARLMKHLFQQTKLERERAIERFREKSHSVQPATR